MTVPGPSTVGGGDSAAEARRAARRATRELRALRQRKARFEATELGRAFALVIARVREAPHLSAQSKYWYERSLGVHYDYAITLGLTKISDYTIDVAQAVVSAPNDDGSPPATGTACGRATTGHLLFMTWYEAGLLAANPVVGRTLRVPRSPAHAVRPLVDAEMQACMRVVVRRAQDTLAPAVFAICRAGGVGSEIAGLTADDIDLELETVQLPGAKDTLARVVSLDDWGLEMVERHLQAPEHARRPYSGSVFGALTTVNLVPTRALKWTGIWDPQAGIKIASVRLWAGVREYQRTARVEDAARLLGYASLDRTAQLLAIDWMPEISRQYLTKRRRQK